MKKLKPHFVYNKKQRNGVFYFLLVLVIVQAVYIWYANTNKAYDIAKVELRDLQYQIDSLKESQLKQQKSFKFNPNFITDEKGYALGMSIDEIDRLLAYRAQDKWMNSVKDFQQITKVSDSLLAVLSVSFKFIAKPIIQKTQKQKKQSKQNNSIVKQSINKATAEELKLLYGIGDVLSNRIIAYRNRLKGYTYMSQLDEVYGLKEEALANVKRYYSVLEIPKIEKLNINTASFKEVLSIVYIDYNTTKLIFNYKDSIDKIENLQEIKKIAGFPIDKYDRIALYLQAE